jgi:hypothetical protein
MCCNITASTSAVIACEISARGSAMGRELVICNIIFYRSAEEEI